MKYKFILTWHEIYEGEVEIEAKNEMEARRIVDEELDFGDAIDEIIQNNSEGFVGVSWGSVEAKQKKKVG